MGRQFSSYRRRFGRAATIALTRRYLLATEADAAQSIDFVDTYRSYVINYGFGEWLVRDFVERAGSTSSSHWATMERILSEPTLPSDLMPRGD